MFQDGATVIPVCCLGEANSVSQPDSDYFPSHKIFVVIAFVQESVANILQRIEFGKWEAYHRESV